MAGIFDLLEKLVAFGTITVGDSGGRVQVTCASGGLRADGQRRSEVRDGVPQWGLPYFYGVAKAGLRVALLRLLRGGLVLGFKQDRPSDAVQEEAGIKIGTAVLRVRSTGIAPDVEVEVTGASLIKLGSDGTLKFVARHDDNCDATAALTAWFAAVQAQIIAAGGGDVGPAPTTLGKVVATATKTKSG